MVFRKAISTYRRRKDPTDPISPTGSQPSHLSPLVTFGQKVSNEKRAPGWLFDIGDDKLTSYIGIIS